MPKRSVKTLFTAVVLVLGLACSLGRYDLNRIRQQDEAFNKEVMLSLYETDAFAKPSRIAEIYQKYEKLFTDEKLLDFLKTKMEGGKDFRQEKRDRFLYREISGSFLGEKTKELDDQALDLQAKEKVVVGGDTIAFRDVDGMIFNEKNETRRKELYYSQGEMTIDKINPVLEQRLDILQNTVKGLGYKNYSDYQEQVRGINFDSLEIICREILGKTAPIYRKLLSEAAKKTLNKKIENIKVYDRSRLFRGEDFDRYFPKEKMVPVFKSTVLDMGIDLTAQKNIHLDDADRPEKEPRPATYCIVVPDDIRVLVKPVGGYDDYLSLFHEMGHAEHAASTEAKEYEFKDLGDYGVTEMFAYIFEDIVSNPIFVKDKLGMAQKDIKEFTKINLLYNLSSLRSYCAKFIFERQLHSGSPDPVTVYQQASKEALLLDRSRQETEMVYLLYGDESFYSINYLQAWLLDAQLRAKLKEEFGENWFGKKECGSYLKSLWGTGMEYTSQEMVKLIGYDRLDASYLISNIEELYNSTK